MLQQVNSLRDKYAPVTTVSTFRKTGEITPEEFVAAGDYLVFKFPTWSWADAEPASLRAPHLPPGKQFLVTRNVPCHRRLDADFAGDAGHEEAIVKDGDDFGGEAGGDEDGWLRTGGLSSSQPLKVREIRTVDDAGNVGDGQVVEDDDDIPDMEDEDDDEAIIHDAQGSGANGYVLLTSVLIKNHNSNHIDVQESHANNFISTGAEEHTPCTSCTLPSTVPLVSTYLATRLPDNPYNRS